MKISFRRKIFRIFLLYILFQAGYMFYQTADEEYRKNFNHFISRETRLIRETLESITDYFVITSDLIAEQDIVDIQKERKEVRKNQFSIFKKGIKILMIRLFKTAKLIIKTVFYPVRLFISLIITALRSTFVFAKSLLVDLCAKLTQIVVGTITLVYRVVRYPLSIVRISFDLIEDLALFLDMKVHSIV
jgi:hypothetical protein